MPTKKTSKKNEEKTVKTIISTPAEMLVLVKELKGEAIKVKLQIRSKKERNLKRVFTIRKRIAKLLTSIRIAELAQSQMKGTKNAK